MSLRLFRRRRGGAIIKRIESGPEFSVYDVKVENNGLYKNLTYEIPLFFGDYTFPAYTHGYTYPVGNFPSYTAIWLANKVWTDYKINYASSNNFIMIVSRFKNGSTKEIGQSFLLLFSATPSSSDDLFTIDNNNGVALQKQINRMDNVLEYPSEGNNILMIQLLDFPSSVLYLNNSYNRIGYSFKYTLDDKSLIYLSDTINNFTLGNNYSSPFFIGEMPLIIPLGNLQKHVILVNHNDGDTYYEYNINAPSNVGSSINSCSFAPLDSLLPIT